MEKTETKPNRLINETSPYLLQHAHNPVDWYPWGTEAFEKAKTEDKPILLSCGYSACHWCHVMSKECFENLEIAELMNRFFINIKVDREERPDLDQIYQHAVQLLTGQGGWPLTVFLDHEKRPFFGGTYFPPVPLHGRMSFPELLAEINTKWQNEKNRIHEAGHELEQYLQANQYKQNFPTTSKTKIVPERDLSVKAISELNGLVDRQYGGFGGAPKFPNPSLLQLFFKVGFQHSLTSEIELALFTLKQMAKGGIYDQIGGGFHRYSTDERWLVPHFEKMLYDNAQLLKIYTIAYQITAEEEFKNIVQATTDYIKREMTAPEGGFYATQDADTAEGEGKYFLWTPKEIRQILEPKTAEAIIEFYHITENGNFEGQTILNRLAEPQGEFAKQNENLELRKRLNQAKATLLAVREQRTKPFCDKKIITSWNGLMISSLAYTYQVFSNPIDYRSAKKAAEFVLKSSRLSDGSLARIYKDDQAKIPALFDDYAFLVQGLLDLFETDFNRYWLEQSITLTKSLSQKFSDGDGRYYLTSVNEELIARPLSGWDQAIPSGVSIHCENLLRLAALTGEKELLYEAENILIAYKEEMSHNFWGYAGLLGVLDNFHQHFKEFVFVSDEPAMPEILVKLRKVFLPYRILLWRNTTESGLESHPAKELLQNKTTINGKPTCYACYEEHCLPPVTEWEDLKAFTSPASELVNSFVRPGGQT